MTSTLGRFYSTAVALVVFFCSWAVIAARPWVSPRAAKTDPRLASLQSRERRLQARATAVQKIVDKRWAAYRLAYAHRQRQIALRKQANASVRKVAALAASRAAAQANAYSASSASAQSAAPAPAPVVNVAPAAPPATTTRTS